MAYPSQPGQYGGCPRQQGPYGPPKKDRAPLIASLVFVAAVLAGLVVTGFVEPGFFLSDDTSGTGGGNSAGAGGADSPGAGAETPAADGGDAVVRAFADDLVAAANAKDKTALREFPCPDARSAVAQAIAEIVTIDSAELRGVSEVDAETYVVGVSITYQGRSAPFAATVGIVDYVVGKNPRLAIDGTDTTNVFHTAMLTGTLDGKPLRRGKITVELKGSHAPCVFTFSAG